MAVIRPPSRITIEVSDRTLFEELSRLAGAAHHEELFGRKWHFVKGKWEGFDRAGVITLSEVVEVSDG